MRTVTIAISSAICLLLAAVYPQADTHRRPCRNQECKEIRDFVKAHYCGESPFGNGPDQSCRVPNELRRSSDVQFKATFVCEINDAENELVCKQKGSIPSVLRDALSERMHRLGLPEQIDSKVLFSQMTSGSTGWSLLQASYQELQDGDLRECDVLAASDAESRIYVLHSVACQSTDFEKPLVTNWSPVDIANIDGRQEFILLGDSYEDHWFEAFDIRNGVPTLAFSGLGYYL